MAQEIRVYVSGPERTEQNEPKLRRVVDILAEDFDAPGWRDALDSLGASGWRDAVRRRESEVEPDVPSDPPAS